MPSWLYFLFIHHAYHDLDSKRLQWQIQPHDILLAIMTFPRWVFCSSCPILKGYFRCSFDDLPNLLLSFFFDGARVVEFPGNSLLPACKVASERFVVAEE